jgi:dTDP-4-dehydrorhamnose reductase
MPDSRPVLVIGASGGIGGYLVEYLRRNQLVVGTRLSSAGPNGFPVLDATSADAVREMLDSTRPNTVVITAALADVDRCEEEPELSFWVNVRLPELVAAECAGRDVSVVHLSTDYVFAGLDGPYAEDDPTGPINVYGQHKLDGEQAVLSSRARAAVLRTSLVYGGTRPAAAELLAASLAAGQAVRLSARHRNSPTDVADLAFAVNAVVGGKHLGVFHIAGPETMSRLSFGRTVARTLGVPETFVQPSAGPSLTRAPRPARCGLRIGKAAQAFGYRPRALAAGLAEHFSAAV